LLVIYTKYLPLDSVHWFTWFTHFRYREFSKIGAAIISCLKGQHSAEKRYLEVT